MGTAVTNLGQYLSLQWWCYGDAGGGGGCSGRRTTSRCRYCVNYRWTARYLPQPRRWDGLASTHILKSYTETLWGQNTMLVRNFASEVYSLLKGMHKQVSPHEGSHALLTRCNTLSKNINCSYNFNIQSPRNNEFVLFLVFKFYW